MKKILCLLAFLMMCTVFSSQETVRTMAKEIEENQLPVSEDKEVVSADVEKTVMKEGIGEEKKDSVKKIGEESSEVIKEEGKTTELEVQDKQEKKAEEKKFVKKGKKTSKRKKGKKKKEVVTGERGSEKISFNEERASFYEERATETVKEAWSPVYEAAPTLGSVPVIPFTEEEFKILATVVYLESGNQPFEGKVAVANSIINRVKDAAFPNTIKGVVYHYAYGNYQFSLARPGGKLEKELKTYGKKSIWWKKNYEQESINAAHAALYGQKSIPDHLCFFVATYSSAGKRYMKTKPGGVVIGDHYFYKW